MCQPVGMVLAAKIGTPTDAGSQLWGSYCIGTIIRVQPDNASILHMGNQQTPSAAVVGGTANPDLFFNCFQGSYLGTA